MGRVVTIALGAFRESVRERVLYNLIVFAFLMIGAAILMGSISVGVERIILVNLGLAAISVFGLLIAIFIGIGLVSKEIDRRTIYNILSKPVARAQFILGKYAGLLLTLFVNTAIMTAGFYIALAIQERGLETSDLNLLVAIYFIVLELVIVVGIAIFFSCLSSSILSAVFTLCLFVIGNFSSDIRAFGQGSGSPLLEKITAFLYYVLPHFGDFNVIDQVAHGVRIPGFLVAANTLYALLYVAVLLSGAILVFEEREF
ncbi:MAG TPA: ABC transporter permease subunit [Terriglobia bacterium]|nr:ABC transporter permease subunit [Terriglobia bacterium]